MPVVTHEGAPHLGQCRRCALRQDSTLRTTNRAAASRPPTSARGHRDSRVRPHLRDAAQADEPAGHPAGSAFGTLACRGQAPTSGSPDQASDQVAAVRSTASGKCRHWERHGQTTEISLKRPITYGRQLRSGSGPLSCLSNVSASSTPSCHRLKHPARGAACGMARAMSHRLQYRWWRCVD